MLNYIDLFSGIGGFRIALEEENCKCVFSSEIDLKTALIYKENYLEYPLNDITKQDKNKIPDHDLLVGGFPCQPFSISGMKRGFEDTRGTLFFDILEILRIKKPKFFILENVKNLIHHDKGNTFKIILESLKSLNYGVSYRLLNASHFGVPQNRERIIIIGIKDNKFFDFEKLNYNYSKELDFFLDKSKNHEYLEENKYTLIENPKIQKSGLIFVGYLNKNIRKNGIKENTLHLSRVHKQPNRIYSSKGYHPTLNAQETGGRYYILEDFGVRKLTLEECFRIMGFKDNFKKNASNTTLYKAIGNSVCVPMVKEIIKELKKY